MQNLSIKLKVAGAFGLLLLVIAGLGAFSLDRLAGMNALTNNMAVNWVPSLDKLGEIETLAGRYRIAEARHIMATTPEDVARMDKLLVERAQMLGKARQDYEPLMTPAEKTAYAEFARAWDQYVAVGRKVADASRNGQAEEARVIFEGDSFKAFEHASAQLTAVGEINRKGADADHLAANNDYQSARTILGAVIGFTVLLTAGMAFLLVSNVSTPIAAMTNVMGRLANNDFTVAIPATDRGDELGRMAQSVLVFKDKLEENRRLEAAAKEAEKRAAEQRKKDMNTLADNFDSSVKVIVNAVSSAATQMQASSQQLASVAEQTHRQSASVAAAAEEASANVQTVAAATGELSASISEIGRQVEVSSKVAGGAVDEANRVSTMVTHLSEAAARIGDVVKLINDIASQTNLLALNATIEAARAGEAGKGFAVVASEVKSLANQTAKATEEIGQQIASVQGATKEAVEAIGAITRTIGQINEITGSIAAAVEEQAAATQEIARNVQQAAVGTQEVTSNIAGVNQASTETGSAAGQVLEAARELSVQAEHLHADVDRFVATVRAA